MHYHKLKMRKYCLKEVIYTFSVHKGIENYIEFDILKYLNQKSKYGLRIFNSFAYIDAKYTTGEFKGSIVEAATKTINRVGLIFNNKQFSPTFQVSNVGDAYDDASNVKSSSVPNCRIYTCLYRFRYKFYLQDKKLCC